MIFGTPFNSKMMLHSNERGYLRAMELIMSAGYKRKDRTGVGTRAMFGVPLTFDLRNGKLPLLTTKKVHYKSVLVELLWMLSGSTNVRDLQAQGVSIWDEWRQPYTLQRELVLVEAKVKDPAPYAGDFKADVTAPEGSEDAKLLDVWRRMMRKCYMPSHDKYAMYGAKGITVDKAWHSAETFLREVKCIHHWQYKQASWDEFELDKDYFGSNQYGIETCVWLPHAENVRYTTAATPLIVTEPSGKKMHFVCAAECARMLQISTSSLNRFVDAGPLRNLKGSNKKYVGWLFEPLESCNSLVRMNLIPHGELGPIYARQWRNWNGELDQIKALVEGLKNDPHGRRHIVTAWNPDDLPYQALPACHNFFQCFVTEEGLILQMYQRSADWFLGVPFNIASYATLTHILAKCLGIPARGLSITFGDAHVYTNHFDQCAEQLTRSVRESPRLIINKTVDSIDKLSYDDFTVEGYNPWPTIKAPVAV